MRRSILGALAAAALAFTLGACSVPSTALVVRVDSNLVPVSELRQFQLTLQRADQPPFWNRTYLLTDHAVTIPAIFSIVPANVGDQRPILVVVTGTVVDGHMVSQQARVTLVRTHVSELDMFLARECLDADASHLCQSDQTCASGGHCVAIDRPPLPDFDASVVDAAIDTPLDVPATDAFDATFPDVFDAPADVPIDRFIEAATDARPDAPTDGGSNGDAACMTCACGTPGGTCCPGDACSDPNTVCRGSTCVACGPTGAPCCAGSLCSDPATICEPMSSICVPCGSGGQPCCAGLACGSGSCIAGTCTGSNPCSACAAGEICCNAGGAPYCYDPSACMPPVPAGSCCT